MSWDDRLQKQKEKAKKEMLSASTMLTASSSTKRPKTKQPDSAPPSKKQAVGHAKPSVTFRAPQAQVASDMYTVLQYLQKVGVEHPQTVEQIESNTQVRIRTNPELLQAMQQNNRMAFVNGMWVYKPEYNFRNKAQLRDFLKENRFKKGILKKDLEHSFSSFEQALAELKSAEEVHSIVHGKDKEILFFNDTSLAYKVDPMLVDIWKEMIIPTDDREIERQLEQVGLKGMQSKTVVDIVVPVDKKPKKKSLRQGRILNTHLAADSGINLQQQSS